MPRKIKLGLDVRTIGPQGTGIGRAMSEITRRLVTKLPGNKWEIHLLPGPSSNIDFVIPDNVIIAEGMKKHNSTAKRAAWHAPAYAVSKRLDIFHSLDFLGPAWKMGFKLVQTIHDIIPALFPKEASWKSLFMCRHIMPRMFAADDRILVSSDNTGRDLVRMYGVRPDKMMTVPLAGREEFKTVPRPETVAAAKQRFGIKKDYFFFIGTIEPKKNVERIVDAFLSMPAIREKYSLVLAGSMGWHYENILKKAEKDPGIIFTGFISDSDLHSLMHGAYCFVFPSVYEGFGLPVLDAMNAGVPVITSASSSLIEIAHGAAVLVDPLNHREIASAMAVVASSGDARKRYSELGLARAKEYTWDKTADTIIKVYEELLG